MSETLNQFLIRRRREIDEERQPLLEQLRALDEELRQLGIAGMALSTGVPTLALPQPPAQSGLRSPRGFIKRAILETLKLHHDGLEAMSIVAVINQRFGKSFKRTSLIPQLSRLKVDGLVALRGNIWTLVDDTADDIEEDEWGEPLKTEFME